MTYWIGEHTALDAAAVEQALEDIPMPDAGATSGRPTSASRRTSISSSRASEPRTQHGGDTTMKRRNFLKVAAGGGAAAATLAAPAIAQTPAQGARGA